MAEYATQRRMFLPIQAIPDRVKEAFIAAEDKNFYSHIGVDPEGIARAAVRFIQNYGSGPPPRGRVDDHAAGGQELPAFRSGERGEEPALCRL
ncbi:transglycosylase domain-containing protein [Novosphingobium sp. MW5]|nr:transglycosylase domain-containing protein [Novosphingobium sp. MW5]